MGVLYSIIVFLHIIGAAMIVGIWIGNMKKPTVHPRQRDGVFLQILTGVMLMGLIPALDIDANYVKLIVKLAIAIVIAVLALIGVRKHKAGQPVSPGLAHSVGVLGLINVALATLWN